MVIIMFVEIEEGTRDEFFMDRDEEQLELYPWIILNLSEIGDRIAYSLSNVEYQVTQEILDEEINDYLSHIHERIIEQAILKLEQNKIDVL